MDKRSISVSTAHDQSEVRSLKAENANLKGIIARITEENQKQISLLKSQLAQYETKSQAQQTASPSKNEQILMKEISKLKKAQSEENTKYSTETQKEISSLRYQIAELKNSISQSEAKNAKLTVENLNLQTTVRKLQEEIEERKVLEESQTKQITEITDDCGRQKVIAERNEKSVDYLIRSLSIISDIPQEQIPTARYFIENPDELISFVDNAETTARLQKNAMQSEIYEASKTLTNTMIMAQQPPLSRPVARALTNLGEVIMDVTEQLNEDHKQTMLLFDHQNESSEYFSDGSIIP